jgi:hypothetical protein
MTLIKEVMTKKYQVLLSQSESGMYYISYHNSLEFNQISEAIEDYGVASFLFDIKLQEMEGN